MLTSLPAKGTNFPLKGQGGSQSMPFDYFHLNSVASVGNNTYLVNSRHYWSTYLVSRTSGDIIWTLQGDTGGDFGSVPDAGRFSWQHDARPAIITPSSLTLTYFNNRAAYPFINGTFPSNGLTLQLALPPSKASPPIPLQYLVDPAQPISSGSQGTHLNLPNGNIFMDYGGIAVMKEFGPGDPAGGDVRWTGRFGQDGLVQSYRGFKAEWRGRPAGVPSLVLEKGKGNGSFECATGYVSWNGATDVEAWRVREGVSKEKLRRVGEVRYTGFETAFGVGKGCVQVAAVVGGREMGRSGVVCV